MGRCHTTIIDIDRGGGTPLSDRGRMDADRDYAENFKRFERAENMADEPNRNKGGEPNSKD